MCVFSEVVRTAKSSFGEGVFRTQEADSIYQTSYRRLGWVLWKDTESLSARRGCQFRKKDIRLGLALKVGMISLQWTVALAGLPESILSKMIGFLRIIGFLRLMLLRVMGFFRMISLLSLVDLS